MGQTAAIVLAAGVSSRMGKFKPLMDLDGKTIIRHVTDYMRRSGADPVLVATGYRAEEIERHLMGENLLFVRNCRYFDTQMFQSILLGAAALPPETERVLLAPADIPLVEDATIQALLKAESAFVRPSFRGTVGHPILLSRTLLDRLMEYKGSGGLRGALQAMGVSPTDIPVEDPGITMDVDTQEAYDAILHYCRKRKGEPLPLQLDMRVNLQAETTFWGAGCVQLLELIQITGSIQRSCTCMHLSYSKAWTMINTMEKQLGYPLLERRQGGSHGGGSELTPAGARLLRVYCRMNEEIRAESQRIFQRYFPGGFPVDM